jgi:hypothetical protein
MARRRFVVVRPLRIFREGGATRTMKEDEEVWAETPIGKERVILYLDNVEFWTYRNAFDASTRPYSPDPL